MSKRTYYVSYCRTCLWRDNLIALNQADCALYVCPCCGSDEVSDLKVAV